MLTKISLALRTRRPLDRTTAWGCLTSNLAGLPGLGSLVAGRRVGFFQAPIAATGFALTLFWLASFVRTWADSGAFPWDGGPHFKQALWGVGIFLVGWTWALFTSLSILREARRAPDPSP